MKTAPRSNYGHRLTSLGKIDNIPIAVGHMLDPNFQMCFNKKVEALQAGIWNELSDYPYVEYSISSYSMVNFKDVLYLFGE